MLEATPSLSNPKFLTFFNSVFPLSEFSQMPSWRPLEMSYNELNAWWFNVAYARVDGPVHATNTHNWVSWCSCFNFNTFLVGTCRKQHAHLHMTFTA